MVDSFTLTVFRHGLTLENERKQYIGWTDSALSEKGRIQTAEVAQTLTSFTPTNILTSDLRRCTETATILFPGQPIQKSKDFREMHFGAFEQKSYAGLKDKKTYQDWIADPFHTRPEGGESFQAFATRVWRGMEKVTQEDSLAKYLTMVVHGGVIRVLLSRLVTSDNHFFDWDIPTSRGFQLTWKTQESFRRLERCTSLSVVPSMAKETGSTNDTKQTST